MSSRATIWICLAALLAAFLGALGWIRPANYFGIYHDDTIYLSSARALAEGRGYVLPSLPGPQPEGRGGPVAQTKYPILYPWLLSWIWRVWPVFPASLGPAVALTALFACAFLVAAFLLLRRMEGLGDGPALLCVGLCALHPFFLVLSGAVLSDIPFMALALWSALAADRAIEQDQKWLPALVAGSLAALAVATRSVGTAVGAGIVAAALYRRAWRAASVMAVTSACGFLPTLLQKATPLPAGAELGFTQTWLYYTSYWGFWKLSVPNWGIFWAMVSSNLRDLLVTPSSTCLLPTPGGEGSFFGMLLSILLTVGIAAGIVRQARHRAGKYDWRAVHFVLVFSVPLTLIWNYPIMTRFLLLFVPLFYAGLWVEGSHLFLMIRIPFRGGRPRSEAAVAAVLGCALAALLAACTSHYFVTSRRGLRSRGEGWADLKRDQEIAYEWVRRHTSPDIRVVTIADAYFFLFTNRQAMWPIAFSTALVYETDRRNLEFQLDHVMDVARHTGARYWIAAEYDYNTTAPEVAERLRRLKAGFPRVFQTPDGRIEIYNLSSIPSESSQIDPHTGPFYTKR